MAQRKACDVAWFEENDVPRRSDGWMSIWSWSNTRMNCTFSRSQVQP